MGRVICNVEDHKAESSCQTEFRLRASEVWRHYFRYVGGLRMKRNSISARLDEDLVLILDEVCRHFGGTRSEVVREALKRHLALLRLAQLRRRVMPFAEARGYLTDEDVFNRVS